MRAFISYSFNDSELYIVPLLASLLKKKGYSVVSSKNRLTNLPEYYINTEIKNAHLFIGIISRGGNQKNKVFGEWKAAKYFRIPSLLLVEKGIRLIDTNKNDRIIYFDRNNPENAINQIIELRNIATHSSNDELRSLASIGLVALGIAAIVSLLSEKKS